MNELVGKINDILDNLKADLRLNRVECDIVDYYKTLIENTVWDYWIDSFGPPPEEEE